MSRSLRRAPGFAIAGVVTLALAAGAMNAVLAVVSGVLLRPLPIRDEGEVVVAWKRDQASGWAHWPFTYPSIRAIEAQLTTVAGSATVDYNGAYSLAVVEGDQGVTLMTGIISGSLLPLLGVTPILGRVIGPDDDVIGAPKVAVISETHWQRRYGGDPGVLDHEFRMYGESYRIVGVIRGGFGLPAGTVMWIAQKPFQPFIVDSEQYPLADLVVRLKPGVILEQFRAELDAVRARTPNESPEAYRSHAAVATPLRDAVVGEARPTLLLLVAGSTLLLLVAATNLGGLFLVRSGSRIHEIAIRSALGGGSVGSLRTLLGEFALIVVVGVALGVPAGWALIALLGPLLPPELPVEGGVSLKPLSILLSTSGCLVAALLAGLAPAFALHRADLVAALREGGRGPASGWGMHPLRRIMVTGQFALAVIIVAAAGLLVRTFQEIRRIEPGFRPEGTLFVDLADSRKYDSAPGPKRNEIDLIVARLEAVPGVIAAAAMQSPPFVGNGGIYGKLVPEGMSTADAIKLPFSNIETVHPSLARALGLRLLRGRFLEPSDREGAPSAVVVNEALATMLWPGQDPIGRIVTPPGGEESKERSTVVGVVGDTRYNELLRAAPTAYFSYRQNPWIPPNFVIRTASDRAAVALIPDLRRAVQEAVPAVAIRRAELLGGMLAKPLARPRLAAVLVTGFALIVLTLAAIGIYGVMASFVVQRTREIGVRMALGATERRVRSLVFRQGMALAAVGLGIGLVVALGAGRLLGGLLFEVAPGDPLTYLVTVTVLVVAAALAMVIPALRAARLDPVVALRSD